MSNKGWKQYIETNKSDGKVALLEAESEYAIKEELLSEKEIELVDYVKRFADSYMELVNKETDEAIQSTLENTFLQEEITYLEKNVESYLYIESQAFESVSVDSLIFEVDSVFRTYELLCGLKLPKKLEKEIRAFIEKQLDGTDYHYQLMFNAQDGVWDLNLPLEPLTSFHKQLKVGELVELAYVFLFHLQATVR